MATVEKATLYPDPEGNPGVTAVRKQVPYVQFCVYFNFFIN